MNIEQKYINNNNIPIKFEINNDRSILTTQTLNATNKFTNQSQFDTNHTHSSVYSYNTNTKLNDNDYDSNYLLTTKDNQSIDSNYLQFISSTAESPSSSSSTSSSSMYNQNMINKTQSTSNILDDSLTSLQWLQNLNILKSAVNCTNNSQTDNLLYPTDAHLLSPSNESKDLFEPISKRIQTKLNDDFITPTNNSNKLDNLDLNSSNIRNHQMNLSCQILDNDTKKNNNVYFNSTNSNGNQFNSVSFTSSSSTSSSSSSPNSFIYQHQLQNIQSQFPLSPAQSSCASSPTSLLSSIPHPNHQIKPVGLTSKQTGVKRNSSSTNLSNKRSKQTTKTMITSQIKFRLDNQPQQQQSNSSVYSALLKEREEFRNNSSIKPPYSYSQLIILAMKESTYPKMTLQMIYDWIIENFSYFKKADPSWQITFKNSIRHNLSLNKCFKKIARQKDEPGKGGFWTLDPEFEKQLNETNSSPPPSSSLSSSSSVSSSSSISSQSACSPSDNNKNLLINDKNDLATSPKNSSNLSKQLLNFNLNKKRRNQNLNSNGLNNNSNINTSKTNVSNKKSKINNNNNMNSSNKLTQSPIAQLNESSIKLMNKIKDVDCLVLQKSITIPTNNNKSDLLESNSNNFQQQFNSIKPTEQNSNQIQPHSHQLQISAVTGSSSSSSSVKIETNVNEFLNLNCTQNTFSLDSSFNDSTHNFNLLKSESSNAWHDTNDLNKKMLHLNKIENDKNFIKLDNDSTLDLLNQSNSNSQFVFFSSTTQQQQQPQTDNSVNKQPQNLKSNSFYQMNSNNFNNSNNNQYISYDYNLKTNTNDSSGSNNNNNNNNNSYKLIDQFMNSNVFDNTANFNCYDDNNNNNSNNNNSNLRTGLSNSNLYSNNLNTHRIQTYNNDHQLIYNNNNNNPNHLVNNNNSSSTASFNTTNTLNTNSLLIEDMPNNFSNAFAHEIIKTMDVDGSLFSLEEALECNFDIDHLDDNCSSNDMNNYHHYHNHNHNHNQQHQLNNHMHNKSNSFLHNQLTSHCLPQTNNQLYLNNMQQTVKQKLQVNNIEELINDSFKVTSNLNSKPQHSQHQQQAKLESNQIKGDNELIELLEYTSKFNLENTGQTSYFNDQSNQQQQHQQQKKQIDLVVEGKAIKQPKWWNELESFRFKNDECDSNSIQCTQSQSDLSNPSHTANSALAIERIKKDINNSLLLTTVKCDQFKSQHITTVKPPLLYSSSTANSVQQQNSNNSFYMSKLNHRTI